MLGEERRVPHPNRPRAARLCARRVDGETVDLGDKEILPEERLDRYVNHDIEVIVDRLVLREGIEQRLTESIETALNLADGHVDRSRSLEGEGEIHTYSQHLFSPATGRSFEDLALETFPSIHRMGHVLPAMVWELA